ncbi:MAG: Immunogenic rane protein YajC [Pseudomonadota bacterium]|jgi:preprotein translocase subunit YajC
MFITPAFAQSSTGGIDPFAQLFPLFILLPIFYFLLIRPQQQKMKKHREMVLAAGRGDTVVTSGGIIGKVTKAKEGENLIEVEIAPNVKVQVVRATLTDVRKKGEESATAASA